MPARKAPKNKYAAFLSHVNHHDFDSETCWEWLGAEKLNGYGNVRVGSSNMPAHRRSYQLFVGDPKSGFDVCHICDNRCCVNPDHLFLGSRKDNMQDAKLKGRIKHGRHLQKEQVIAVAEMIEGGAKLRVISNQLGIGYGTLSNIKAGRSYKEFTGYGESNGQC